MLTGTADGEGRTGEVQWNFEKFLIDTDGTVVARFGPQVAPVDPELLRAVHSVLA